MPKSLVRPEDIYEIRQPIQCKLSPAGDRLVVVVTQADKEKIRNLSHLWMIPLEDAGEARQFTEGTHSEQNPRWSPDGSMVAFLSDRSGKNEIWTIPADGGEARRLTKMEGTITDFDWHPSGRRLVVSFVPQDPEAKEREERKKRGGPATEAPRVRRIRRLFYKLDGSGFLPAGRAHLWLVDARSGRARRLTQDDRYDEGEPRFSPDGKWIYFASNRTEDPDRLFQRIDLWRMPARGGTIEKVRNFDGPSYNFSFSPDGRWITYLGTPDPNVPWNQHHVKLWRIPSAGGRPVELTARLDRSCENSTINDTFGTGPTEPAVWSPEGEWVYFQVVHEGNTEIWRVRPFAGRAGSRRSRRTAGRRGGSDGKRLEPGGDGNGPEPVLSIPGAVIDFAIDFERGWIHSLFADPSNPGEVRSDPLPLPAARGGRTVAIPETSRQVRPLVRSSFNTGWLARRRVAEPEEFWFEGKGGHRLQGWILDPPGARGRGQGIGSSRRKGPGVLYIHGGPATQYGRVFFHEFQVLAANGYTVFYSNPRGGTGYSERHLNAIVGRWGTIDYDDLMRFADTALRRSPGVDRRRVGVAGGSYGGFMTNWIIGHTGRFACAVTSRSISNMMSFIGSSDFGFSWPQEFAGPGPWEDPQRYLRMSPLTYLRNMRTPTLIEHQEEDYRCPIEQAEQLWASLKLKGIPVEFLRYPGEPHGMSRNGRPDRRIDRLERIVAWLDRWTKSRGVPMARRRARR